ncbi:MAG: hypothetical protein LBC05_01105 [Endomicrobium sp.]|jgi:3-deoxy-D-manno-octulosonic-acid transferase|nr:hypothetical protein [Endomicrobium sp.]
MIRFLITTYNVLFVLFSPFAVFTIIFSNKYRNDVLYRLSERFAIYKGLNINNCLKKTLWIHCASLGEVRSIEPILDNFKDKYYIVLTLVTKSGREYAKKLKKANFVALLPLDIYPIMYRAFSIIKPDVLVIVETEFWPNMLYIASNKRIKIIIINGRISAQSFKLYKNFKFFWSKFLKLIDLFIAKSREDANRFIFFGNKSSKIVISGNIKYDKNITVIPKREDLFSKKEDFIFTAGSIRSGEEKIIIDAYSEINLVFSNIKFFVAPRHISKINKLIKNLKNKDIEYSLFSEGFYNASFVLIDIFGKLQDIYAISDVCYIGGSFVNKGGHNPIEPAAYSKPILFGKNMDNFKIESEILIKYGGAFVVHSLDDLVYKIKKFIYNKKFLNDTGLKALKAVESQKGAIFFTIKQIENFLNV